MQCLPQRFKQHVLSSAVLLALAATPVVHAAEGDAVGEVIQVNTTILGGQYALWGQGGVAMDADGDFGVAWADYYYNDGSFDGAFMRRFSTDGSALDASDRVVNAHTDYYQNSLGIAAAPDGRFVALYYDRDPSFKGLYAQRYDTDGVAQGDPIQVDTAGANSRGADVAMAADGAFVVAWIDTAGKVVVVRRFSADGTALDAADVTVSTTATLRVDDPKIAIDPAGNYTIVWGMREDAGDYNVRARRYTADGNAIDASDTLVNTTTSGDQTWPDVAVDADGDYVVAWVSYNSGIHARRFNAAGDEVQGEFAVMLDADYSNAFFSRPAVAMDAEGDFAIAVYDYGSSDGAGYATYMQRYNSSGVAHYASPVNVGGPAGNYGAGGIAMDADGDTVVVFTDVYGGEDGSGSGVFAQRYEGKGHTVDLGLVGSGDTDTLGGTLTYTFTVTNSGSGVALGLSLEDALPADVSYTSFSSIDDWSCSDASGTVTCTLPSLASGADSSVDITVDTGAVSGSSIDNTATITNGVTDANSADNSDTVTTGATASSSSDSSGGGGAFGWFGLLLGLLELRERCSFVRWKARPRRSGW